MNKTVTLDEFKFVIKTITHLWAAAIPFIAMMVFATHKGPCPTMEDMLAFSIYVIALYSGVLFLMSSDYIYEDRQTNEPGAAAYFFGLGSGIPLVLLELGVASAIMIAICIVIISSSFLLPLFGMCERKEAGPRAMDRLLELKSANIIWPKILFIGAEIAISVILLAP